MYTLSSDVAYYVHITTLVVTVLGILLADHAGFDWVRGKTPTIAHTLLRRLHWWVGVGLGSMLGSGTVLFWPMRNFLLSDPAFYVKMSFVLALLVNSFVIERLMNLATSAPYATLPQQTKTKLIASGAVSTLSWLGAGITAFFLF